jgi:hypothetical protein
VTLSDEIGAFGSLVGLLLALVTLLTANRASVVGELRKAADLGRFDKVREVLLDSLLAAITGIVFASGLPLALRAVDGLHPLAHGGPLRSVFVLTWVLLLGLVGWQISLTIAALKLKPPRAVVRQ